MPPTVRSVLGRAGTVAEEMENVNVKDFIVEDGSLDISPGEAKTEVSSVHYETVFVSGCDFALRKISRKASVLLVFLISQGQMYTKAGSNGSAEKLTLESLMRFCSCVPSAGLVIADAEGHCPTWIPRLKRSRLWCSQLLNVLECPQVKEYISAGLLSLEDMEAEDPVPRMPAQEYSIKAVKAVFTAALESGANEVTLRRDMYKACSYCYDFGRRTREYSMLRSLFCSSGAMSDHGTAYDLISSRWGVDGIHQIVRSFFQFPLDAFPDCGTLKSILFRSADAIFSMGKLQYHKDDPSLTVRTEFGLQKFIWYMFSECARQGFAHNPEVFWSSWSDILNMQLDYYGKITDKYPHNLATDEKIISYTLTEIYMQKGCDGFNEAVEKYRCYEYEKDGLKIVVPKTPGDIIREGQQQSNCVGTYIGRIAAGQCMIFFVRSAANPDKSLVTVQILNDGALGQVLGKSNSAPSADVRQFVAAWHTRFFEPDGKLVGLP